jgi:hypothetical protein
MKRQPPARKSASTILIWPHTKAASAPRVSTVSGPRHVRLGFRPLACQRNAVQSSAFEISPRQSHGVDSRWLDVDVYVCNHRPPKTPDAVAPSPWDLRGKIILKGKRHTSTADADDDDDEDEVDLDILSKAAKKDKSKAAKLKKLKPTKTFKEKAKKQSVSDKLSSLIWMNAGNKKELGEIWKNGALPSV